MIRETGWGRIILRVQQLDTIQNNRLQLNRRRCFDYDEGDTVKAKCWTALRDISISWSIWLTLSDCLSVCLSTNSSIYCDIRKVNP